MSKKVNKAVANETVVNETVAVTKRSLEEYLTAYPNVSLRKLALACGISYNWILKCSKEPIAGESYDPDKINYAKVSSVFFKKEIDFDTLDWDALNTQQIKATLSKDISEFNIGDSVYLRSDNETPFKIYLKTDSHIVIMKDNETVPHVFSIDTFFMKGPSKQPRSKTTIAKGDNK